MRDIVRRVDRLQRLAVFEASARLGSFTAAAAELNMTQPAVTRQVRAFERSLGIDLFVRTSNRSTLTDAGHRLFNHVGAGFEVIEGGLTELIDPPGHFVLAAHPGIAQTFLVPYLDELKAVLGDIDLLLRLFDADSELAEGSYDAAIRVGTGQFEGSQSQLLFPEVVVPIAAPRLAEQLGLDASSTAAELNVAPFVHMDERNREWMGWTDWLAHFGIELERTSGRVLFNNYPMVLERVILGYGVGLGWRPMVDNYIERGALVAVGPEVTSSSGYYVTWPTGQTTEPRSSLVDVLLGLRDQVDQSS